MYYEKLNLKKELKMNTIKQNDLRILSQYNFIENGSNKQNDRLLGLRWIKEGDAWKQELTIVSRQDVTCWSLFLSLFGLGKLKYIDISLDTICRRLYQYSWNQIKLDLSQAPENDEYKAYITVCQLANRQMQRRRFELFKEVSNKIEGEYNHYWNPAMNGRFLLSLHDYYMPKARDVELRFKDSKTPVQRNQMLTKSDINRIEIGFKYELVIKEKTDRRLNAEGDFEDETITNHYYHYPTAPYYQAEMKNHRFPARKELPALKDVPRLNAIKLNDLKVLSQYRFIENGNSLNDRLLGLKSIKEGSIWKKELTEVSRQDVTCWSLFLRIFGFGKLKNIDISLQGICDYLSQYQWEQIKLNAIQNPENDDYQAFKAVCQLANRQMTKSQQSELFIAVSNKVEGDFNHYWNPAINGRTLLRLHNYFLPDAKKVDLRFKDSKVSVQPTQLLTPNDMMNIEVGFAHEKIRRGDDHHFHYPLFPYYSTSSKKRRRPPRNEI